jgi:hypothetical protein
LDVPRVLRADAFEAEVAAESPYEVTYQKTKRKIGESRTFFLVVPEGPEYLEALHQHIDLSQQEVPLNSR